MDQKLIDLTNDEIVRLIRKPSDEWTIRYDLFIIRNVIWETES